MKKKTVTMDMVHPFLRFFHVVCDVRELAAQKTLVCPYDCRLFFVRKGSVSVQLSTEKYALSENDMLYLPSGTAYRVVEFAPGSELMGLNFDFLPERLDLAAPIAPEPREEFNSFKLVENVEFTDAVCFNEVSVLRGRPILLSHLNRIEEELSAQRLYFREISAAWLRLTLVQMARELAAGGREEPVRIVERVIDIIHHRYREPLTNEDIALELSYHPNHLNRLMLKHTGQTLHHYLLGYRLSVAMNLLKLGSLSVAEVAESSGFGDVQQFSRFFKHALGQTPSAFRKSGV